MPLEGLKPALMDMASRGQIFTIKPGGIRYFRMLPWVFGIYEFQLDSMDSEFAELNEAYWPYLANSFFFRDAAAPLRPTAVEGLPSPQEALPYEKVSAIIEKGCSFMVNECICKKEKGLLGAPCDRPLHVCMGIALVPGAFDKTPSSRTLTKEEAYALLKMTEDAGLVHLISNVQHGHYFICNCCKCCWGCSRHQPVGVRLPSSIPLLREIDGDLSTGCGIARTAAARSRPVEDGDIFRVLRRRCIRCGLCVTACPAEASALPQGPRTRSRLRP